MAWNGVGLVLAELRKFEDARNAFARAIQARPDFAEAHYNMSFTLSNLGDFEGALRETKRALELDPYYVPQKFELAMDVEYEDPDLSIKPDLGGGAATEDAVADFNFDPASFDGLFSTMSPNGGGGGDAHAARSSAAASGDASSFAMANDFLSKGLYDRASAEINRAIVTPGLRRPRHVLLCGAKSHRSPSEADLAPIATRPIEAWIRASNGHTRRNGGTSRD